MKIASAKYSLAGIVATAPAVMGNAWLSINIYGQASCAGQILGWTQADVTSAFTNFGVMAYIGFATTAPPADCSALVTQAGLLKSISLPADKSAYVSTSLDFPKTGLDASLATYVNGTSVQANMGDLLAGTCIPLNINGQKLWINGGCTDASVALAVPASSGNFAVRTASLTDGCSYSSSYLVQGVSADNQAHAETGGLFTSPSSSVGIAAGTIVPFTTTGTCAGSAGADSAAATIAVSVSVGGVLTTLNADAALSSRSCSASVGNAAKSVFTKTLCKAGTGAANNGASLVDTTAAGSITHQFPAGMGVSAATAFNQGGLSMGVMNMNAATMVTVNFTTAPVTTSTIPRSVFNTYYQIQSDASASYGTGAFAANLTLTYTAAQLGTSDASKLRWAKYNPASGAWDEKSDTVVDASQKTVLYTTDSFSEWTVVAAATTSAALATSPSAMLLLGLIVAVTGFSVI